MENHFIKIYGWQSWKLGKLECDYKCFYCHKEGPSYHNTYSWGFVKICPVAYKEVCEFAEQTFVINDVLSLLVNDVALSLTGYFSSTGYKIIATSYYVTSKMY